jgi:hypothetical protein
MKSNSLFFGICIFSLCFSFYSTTSFGQYFITSFDFRSTRWRMSKEDVKESETLELIEEFKLDSKLSRSFGTSEAITYTGKIRGRKVLLIYVFNNNKLVRTLQCFTEQYKDKTTFIDEYNKHELELTEKYGLPIENGKLQLGETEKHNRVDLLNADNLSLYSVWEDQSTRIDLLLNNKANTDKIVLMISYVSKD